MAIRGCRVIALEGSHGTGKSTLVHALVAHYKCRNIHATSLAETARLSPFVEEIVVHKVGEFDITAELHLFTSQIAQEQLLARHHEILVCDKTVANAIGYARLLLDKGDDSFSSKMLQQMEHLSRVYVQQYDAVIYVSDFYELTSTNDPFRPNDIEFQRRADESIKKVCNQIGLSFLELPKGLSTEQKIAWINSKTSFSS